MTESEHSPDQPIIIEDPKDYLNPELNGKGNEEFDIAIPEGNYKLLLTREGNHLQVGFQPFAGEKLPESINAIIASEGGRGEIVLDVHQLARNPEYQRVHRDIFEYLIDTLSLSMPEKKDPITGPPVPEPQEKQLTKEEKFTQAVHALMQELKDTEEKSKIDQQDLIRLQEHLGELVEEAARQGFLEVWTAQPSGNREEDVKKIVPGTRRQFDTYLKTKGFAHGLGEVNQRIFILRSPQGERYFLNPVFAQEKLNYPPGELPKIDREEFDGLIKRLKMMGMQVRDIEERFWLDNTEGGMRKAFEDLEVLHTEFIQARKEGMDEGRRDILREKLYLILQHALIDGIYYNYERATLPQDDVQAKEAINNAAFALEELITHKGKGSLRERDTQAKVIRFEQSDEYNQLLQADFAQALELPAKEYPPEEHFKLDEITRRVKRAMRALDITPFPAPHAKTVNPDQEPIKAEDLEISLGKLLKDIEQINSELPSSPTKEDIQKTRERLGQLLIEANHQGILFFRDIDTSRLSMLDRSRAKSALWSELKTNLKPAEVSSDEWNNQWDAFRKQHALGFTYGGQYRLYIDRETAAGIPNALAPGEDPMLASPKIHEFLGKINAVQERMGKKAKQDATVSGTPEEIKKQEDTISQQEARIKELETEANRKEVMLREALLRELFSGSRVPPKRMEELYNKKLAEYQQTYGNFAEEYAIQFIQELKRRLPTE